MQFINVVFEEEETVDSVTPRKTKVLKLSKQQLGDEREEKKLQLFSEAVLALKGPSPNQSGYEPLNLENRLFVNSGNINATNLRFNP